MSNVLTFPTSDLASEWTCNRPRSMKADARRNETKAVLQDVFELHARVRQRADDAIAALECAHAKLLNATQVLENHSLRTKLQSDIGVLEDLLKHAKSDLSDLLYARV